jgi:phosphoenolpyruvate carboxylase
VDYIQERNREEPWRMVAYLMRARVLLAANHPESPGAYKSPADLLADLGELEASLVESGALSLVRTYLVPFKRQVGAFGFHSASLDVRQNSAFHDRALAQLLAAAGEPDGESYADWPVERRRALMERELASPRPFLAPGLDAGPEAEAVLGTYRVLADHLKAHGRAGLGALIVSMTRSAEDLYAVYILAREAGLVQWGDSGLACPLPVTPLFETMADLEAGPKILEDFIAHPITQRSMCLQAAAEFQVMVGYSDSNKDCGIFASQWALHRAQAEISAVAASHQVKPVFFHGRGGTVGRGAGPTHSFMDALPRGSLTGHLRMTEQGETISQKYAHIASSLYNLESLMASTTATTAEHLGAVEGEDSLASSLGQVAGWSRDAYRDLLQTTDFIKFYRQATPIDALENSRIGSRPARRTGQATLQDLRAIPWVFSWTQARFYLPGWFGVGSGLEKLSQLDPAAWEKLKAAKPNHAFLRYVLANVESSLVSANVSWMRQYADLVEDVELRERFLGIILAEYERTVKALGQLHEGSFLERRPRMAFTLSIREAPLEVLHAQQVSLLREWRGLLAAGDIPSADAMIPDLLISINAVASGLRTTG